MANEFIDIGLFYVDGCIQPQVENGDLVGDKTLETAVIISLFSDHRATVEELPSGHEHLRGWWADEFSSVEGDENGSKLWVVLSRAVINNSTLATVETLAAESLQWLIDDGVATAVQVTATQNEANDIIFGVSITRPELDEPTRFDVIWNEQELKRA